MIRSTLTAGSAYACMGINGASGYQWQYRSSTGGSTTTTTSGTGTAPNIWVKVVRSGSTLTGYNSTDGATWTQVGSTTISLGTNVYIGFVNASGTTTTLNTTGFDNVAAP
jgi:hypothetical protein